MKNLKYPVSLILMVQEYCLYSPIMSNVNIVMPIKIFNQPTIPLLVLTSSMIHNDTVIIKFIFWNPHSTSAWLLSWPRLLDRTSCSFCSSSSSSSRCCWFRRCVLMISPWILHREMQHPRLWRGLGFLCLGLLCFVVTALTSVTLFFFFFQRGNLILIFCDFIFLEILKVY